MKMTVFSLAQKFEVTEFIKKHKPGACTLHTPTERQPYWLMLLKSSDRRNSVTVGKLIIKPKDELIEMVDAAFDKATKEQEAHDAR